MSVFDEITTEQKILNLGIIKGRTLDEIWNLCVLLELDTNTFDPNTYTVSDPETLSPEFSQLKVLCDRFIIIQNKILSL